MDQPYELVYWCLDCLNDLWVTVILLSSRPFKCIGSDVFYFYLLSRRPMNKWLSILVMPVKYNNNLARDWLTVLSRTWYLILVVDFQIYVCQLFSKSTYNPYDGVSLLNIFCQSI